QQCLLAKLQEVLLLKSHGSKIKSKSNPAKSILSILIENISTILGDVAVFRCTVDGSQPLCVQWQKDENCIAEDPNIERRFENKEATLRILTCEAIHSGKYTCQVVNDAGQDRCFATLKVQGKPPMIHEKPELIKVTRGDPVSLECRVAGSPQIRVKWTKEGKELQSSRKHHLYFDNNLSSLNIQSSQPEDSGEYLFEAKNSFGTCRCKVMLVVLEQIVCVLSLILMIFYYHFKQKKSFRQHSLGN
uniref:Ig-like domain-containing protein n=1 Tax=Sander lucioperca TaxID=283035 RepID=A0A8C9Z9W6_SANLU